MKNKKTEIYEVTFADGVILHLSAEEYFKYYLSDPEVVSTALSQDYTIKIMSNRFRLATLHFVSGKNKSEFLVRQKAESLFRELCYCDKSEEEFNSWCVVRSEAMDDFIQHLKDDGYINDQAIAEKLVAVIAYGKELDIKLIQKMYRSLGAKGFDRETITNAISKLKKLDYYDWG